MAMYRMLMRFTVVCAAVVLWSSGTTMAFTLQFGPDAPAHVVDEVYTTNGADVPTPQLFRVVIGHEEAHSGTASLSAAYSVAVPEMRVSIGRPVPAAPAPNSGTSRYLRGAELLLLRQAHTVAESPGQNRDGVRD
jgi:hypothetical protein